MLALDRAVARNPDGGAALSLPWRKLSAVAKPRRGQVTLVYGPAGSCKSMLVLNMVLSWNLPTLFLSPDTDQHDVANRVVAFRQQVSTNTVEQGVEVGAYDLADELGDMRDWCRWSFDPSPTLDDIDLELAAFTEQFGAPPEVIVVDTLSDVHQHDDDEYGGKRRNMQAFKHLARVTGAAVIVITHTTGEYDSDIKPAPRKGIDGKLSKESTLILSVARNGPHLGVAVVKQRSGYQDVTADNPIWLTVQPDRATVSDPIESTYTSWSPE